MAAGHIIGTVAQIPPGEGRNFAVGGKTIAVFHTHAGDVFATQPDCPHRGGPLADGLLGDAAVMCPLHDRLFDLRTGAQMGGDYTIRCFPVQVTPDGAIVLMLDDGATEAAESVGAEGA